MKDPGQKRKQLWNVIIPQVCTEVINEMIILAISLERESYKIFPIIVRAPLLFGNNGTVNEPLMNLGVCHVATFLLLIKIIERTFQNFIKSLM